MRFTDGFRLAELASGDEARAARANACPSLRDAIAASEPPDRTRWLGEVSTYLRRVPKSDDERVAAILGSPSRFTPRRQYRPPSGLRQHLLRRLRAEPTSVRAAREIAELEGRWDE